MDVRQVRNRMLAERVIRGLESRNMEGYYAETKEDALQEALKLIPEGSQISWGGTYSVEEIGLLKAVYEGNFEVIDREKAPNDEERRSRMLQAYECDYYLGSTNAITEDGVLVNIDGNANRVSAYAYGPKHLLLIVGINKVVKDEDDALSRARNLAAPVNAQRFEVNTPCKTTGCCADCKSGDCICCQVLTTRFSRQKGRIKVILVGEVLGF